MKKGQRICKSAKYVHQNHQDEELPKPIARGSQVFNVVSNVRSGIGSCASNSIPADDGTESEVMVGDIYRYHELSMWPGTRGLKGLGCKVKDGPTHPQPTCEGWPLTAVPYPQAGGQTAVHCC